MRWRSVPRSRAGQRHERVQGLAAQAASRRRTAGRASSPRVAAGEQVEDASPMAQPTRARPAPPRRKTPSGRFWRGKSVSGSLRGLDAAPERRVVGLVGPSGDAQPDSTPRARRSAHAARRTSRTRTRWRSRAARLGASRGRPRLAPRQGASSVEAERGGLASFAQRAPRARADSVPPRAASAAATNTFRKPCITARGRVGGVGERLLGPHGMVQAGGRLERQRRPGAAVDEARDVAGSGNRRGATPPVRTLAGAARLGRASIAGERVGSGAGSRRRPSSAGGAAPPSDAVGPPAGVAAFSSSAVHDRASARRRR